jgi:uncharacterized protein with PQ loop repeat
MTGAIGWLAAAILLLTLGRQVYTQWRSGSAQGVSQWLFIGQISASVGFVVYSCLLGSWVFVATNGAILATALLGQFIDLRNRHRYRGPEPDVRPVAE